LDASAVCPSQDLIRLSSVEAPGSIRRRDGVRASMLTHARRLARYNAPLYVAATLAVATGVAVAALAGPLALRIAGALVASGAAWFGAASFLAFHAMFDRSGFLEWAWLRDELPAPPARWVHVSAGLELTNAPMAELFPGTEGIALDIYDPVSMPAPAVG